VQASVRRRLILLKLISYSNDSSEHRDRVLVLSKHLRKDGIDFQQ
jgi:hypothetical protein